MEVKGQFWTLVQNLTHKLKKIIKNTDETIENFTTWLINQVLVLFYH